MISLDGVLQAPGGPDEDTSGGFAYGGWVAPFDADARSALALEQMQPTDILLGRKTFDIFESYWPAHADGWPGINEVTKYVLSRTRTGSDWQHCVFLDSVDAIRQLKASGDGDLKVWGSSELVQLLLEQGLADELWLRFHPLLLGKGKKLFADTALPSAFTLARHVVTPGGVIFASYVRSGPVQTGTIGA